MGEADDALVELATQIEALGTATDVTRLTAVIKATREIGDIAGHVANSKREAREARAAIDRGLNPCALQWPTTKLWSSCPPPMDDCRCHRDACRNLEQRLELAPSACAPPSRTRPPPEGVRADRLWRAGGRA